MDSSKPESEPKGQQDLKGLKDRISIRMHPRYINFSNLHALEGISYEDVETGTFYSLVGDTLKENLIIFGKVYEDTRIHPVVVIISGKGKGALKYVIEETAKRLGKKYVEPTSLSPEQLVGKIVWRETYKEIEGKRKKVLEPVKNPGHLAADFVSFDNCLALFCEDRYEEARHYINKALDPIGRNLITKRNVDNLEAETLRYEPKCTSVFFIQPHRKIPLGNIITGLARRLLILSVRPTKEEMEHALLRRLFDSPTGDWDAWTNFLSELKQKQFNWHFPDDVKQLLQEYTKQLIDMHESSDLKRQEILQVMFFAIENLLIKMSAICAAVDFRDEITKEDVLIASADLSTFLDSHLDYICSNAASFNSTSTIESDMHIILEILKEEGAISESASRLTIRDCWQKFTEETGKSIDSAQRAIRKLREVNLVGAKQVGKHSSLIWLIDNSKREP